MVLSPIIIFIILHLFVIQFGLNFFYFFLNAQYELLFCLSSFGIMSVSL